MLSQQLKLLPSATSSMSVQKGKIQAGYGASYQVILQLTLYLKSTGQRCLTYFLHFAKQQGHRNPIWCSVSGHLAHKLAISKVHSISVEAIWCFSLPAKWILPPAVVYPPLKLPLTFSNLVQGPTNPHTLMTNWWYVIEFQKTTQERVF